MAAMPLQPHGLQPGLLGRDSPRAAQPRAASSAVALKPHQLAMLQRCADIEALASSDAPSDGNNIGVMSDMPGSGKTFVLLSLILRGRESATGCDGVNVIVVPQNIYTQWERSIRQFSPTLRYRRFVTYEDASALYYPGARAELAGLDAILTTPMYYNVIVSALTSPVPGPGKKPMDRVIIDEVDSVAFLVDSRSSQAFHCPHGPHMRDDERLVKDNRAGRLCRVMWLVSASFQADNLAQIGMRNVTAAQLAQRTCRCDPAFVKECFAMEEPSYRTLACRNVYIDGILNGLVSDEEARAINALDFGAIKKQYNTVTATTEQEAVGNLVHDLEETIAAAKRSLEELAASVACCRDDPTKSAVLQGEQREKRALLARSEDRLASIRARVQENAMCLICYCDIDKKTLTRCCQNAFCWACLSHWLARQSSCPLCRSKNIELIVTEGGPERGKDEKDEKAEKDQDGSGGSAMTKMQQLRAMFDGTDASAGLGDKVIVFSDYRPVFRRVAALLDELGVRYIELDGGSIDAIDRDVREYKSPQSDVRVLMTNSSMYGCGMNLENTTDVVVMHQTRSQLYEQVIGRAQRPGRTARLRVWKLLHENEAIA